MPDRTRAIIRHWCARSGKAVSKSTPRARLATFKEWEEANRPGNDSVQPSIVIQKARSVRILNKLLVVCAILVAGCAPDRDAATNRFISKGTLALQGTENRDEISYWNGTGSQGEPRIVIDLDQQR